MAKEAKKPEEAEEEKDEKEEKGKKDKKEDAEGGEAKEGEGGEGEGGEGEGAPKKSKKKLIIIAAIAAVVLIAGGVGAFFMLSGKSEEQAAAEGEGKGEAKTAVYYTLPEFLVNLNSGGKQVSFLKMVVVLELESSLDVVSIEGSLPKLLDAFNTYLRELRSSDLSGSAGIQRLREELLLRANKAADPIKINDVLFKEIVVQ